MNKKDKELLYTLIESIAKKKEESKTDYSLLLTKEHLYRAEYRELLKRHNSPYYKSLDNKNKLEYNCEFWHRIITIREEVKRSRCPALSEKEIEDYINLFLYK